MFWKVPLFFNREYRNVRFVVGSFFESNGTADQRKKGMVLAHTYILARMVHRATLAYDDIPSLCKLATIEFNPQSLTF